MFIILIFKTGLDCLHSKLYAYAIEWKLEKKVLSYGLILIDVYNNINTNFKSKMYPSKQGSLSLKCLPGIFPVVWWASPGLDVSIFSDY